MKVTKKSFKKSIQAKTDQLKTQIQDRINQIRRSYPYSDSTQLPGLSVSQLAGDPAEIFINT